MFLLLSPVTFVVLIVYYRPGISTELGTCMGRERWQQCNVVLLL